MAMTAENFVRLARAYCAQQMPWFAPALFRCRFHFTEQVEVAAIDQYFNIYFNPVALREIEQTAKPSESISQLGFIWIHEISHILREHSKRARHINADAKLWNMATDLEINDGDWPELTMPEIFPGMHPDQFGFPAGRIAEFYYKALGSTERKRINRCLRQSNGTCLEELYDEGSGVHGQSRSWETDRPGNPQQLDEVEVEMIRRSVAKEMLDQKSRGSMPGGWIKWAEEKLRPRVDWRKVLRHRMSMAINRGIGARIDYSFRRPSRRQAVYQPVLPPSLSGDVTARISCVVDTSGSMSSRELAQAVAEVCAVLKVFQVPVTIIPCDARAYDPIRIATPSDYFKLQELRGGGGTNMIVGIEAALQQKPAPDCVLVLTDGYTPFPAKLYKKPVIFGIFKKHVEDRVPKPQNPPWKPDTVVEILLDEN